MQKEEDLQKFIQNVVDKNDELVKSGFDNLRGVPQKPSYDFRNYLNSTHSTGFSLRFTDWGKFEKNMFEFFLKFLKNDNEDNNETGVVAISKGKYKYRWFHNPFYVIDSFKRTSQTEYSSQIQVWKDFITEFSNTQNRFYLSEEEEVTGRYKEYLNQFKFEEEISSEIDEVMECKKYDITVVRTGSIDKLGMMVDVFSRYFKTRNDSYNQFFKFFKKQRKKNVNWEIISLLPLKTKEIKKYHRYLNESEVKRNSLEHYHYTFFEKTLWDKVLDIVDNVKTFLKVKPQVPEPTPLEYYQELLKKRFDL